MLQRCLILFAYVILLLRLGKAMYLPDYEYVNEIGWLRLHTLPATWTDARVRCNVEGDVLASPTKKSIVKLMKIIMAKHGLIKSSVFVDVHTAFTEGVFISIDGTPLSNISLKWAVGEPNNLNGDEDCLEMTGKGELADVSCSNVRPFICLKSIGSTATRSVACDTKDKEYKWEPRTGSCYKFHYDARPWFIASMTCAAEHAHLAIVNSDVEAEVIKELYARYPPQSIKNAHYTEYAHVGFWDWNEKSTWVTLYGETLDQAGYNKWSPNEPNNPGREICGSLTRRVLLNDGFCATKLPFICESNVTTKVIARL